MKKRFIIFFIFMLSIITNSVYATTSIKSAYMMGGDTTKVGSTFSQSFVVSFSDLKKASTDTLGIWLVGFQLEYDESIFDISKVSTDGNVWETVIYKDDGKVYVLSEFSKDPFRNGCVDGVLYCADYITDIYFYVKDTDKTSTTIKMKEISAGAFQVSGDMNPEYLVDDMIELGYNDEASIVVNITKDEITVVEEPKSIISNNAPKKETPKTQTKSSASKAKSNNNNLKSLEIDDYEINFNKDIKDYEIMIKEDVNTLKINAVPDDSKANIEIIGADNLKENNYKVLIKVKAENNDELVYTIKTKVITMDVIEDNPIEQNKKTFKFDKKTTLILLISAGVLFSIIIVAIILNIISSKKIEKDLDLDIN